MKAILNRWTDDDEKKVWHQAIFAFDSSTLLNFYEFSESSRQDIYDNIFPLLKDRLWITNQTEYEFLKNRDKVINKPKQLYAEMKEKYSPAPHLKPLVQAYEALKQHTSKDNFHPFLSPGTFADLDLAIAAFTKSLDTFDKQLNKEIEQRVQEHADSTEKDNLLSFFQVTPGYTFTELMELVQEGEFRYRQKIPPGYMDETDRDKVGIAKFGDLIIWKQLIQQAKKLQLPLLLIIDDVKEDWGYTEKGDKRKLVAPREELIKEMLDEAGVQFWTYTSSQFVHKAKTILKSTVKAEVIEEVEAITHQRQVDPIEVAVFRWLRKNLTEGEVVYSDDFGFSDHGADLVQVIDGVPFAYNIVTFRGRPRMKYISDLVNEIEDATDTAFTFENNRVIVIADTIEWAVVLNSLLKKETKVSIITGFINGFGEFAPVLA